VTARLPSIVLRSIHLHVVVSRDTRTHRSGSVATPITCLSLYKVCLLRHCLHGCHDGHDLSILRFCTSTTSNSSSLHSYSRHCMTWHRRISRQMKASVSRYRLTRSLVHVSLCHGPRLVWVTSPSPLPILRCGPRCQLRCV